MLMNSDDEIIKLKKIRIINIKNFTLFSHYKELDKKNTY